MNDDNVDKKIWISFISFIENIFKENKNYVLAEFRNPVVQYEAERKLKV